MILTVYGEAGFLFCRFITSLVPPGTRGSLVNVRVKLAINEATHAFVRQSTVQLYIF